jgi:hypothetical protein
MAASCGHFYFKRGANRKDCLPESIDEPKEKLPFGSFSLPLFNRSALYGSSQTRLLARRGILLNDSGLSSLVDCLVCL